MQFVSLKSAICRTLASAVGAESGYRLSFLTPAGVVSGVCASEVDQSPRSDGDESYKELLSGAHAILNKGLQEGATQAPDDGYILLKDVTIRPIGTPFGEKKDRFILFINQTLGVYLDPGEH